MEKPQVSKNICPQLYYLDMDVRLTGYLCSSLETLRK